MLEAGTSMSPKDAFLDGCRFAKLVETPNGNGILINGAVFLVQAPPAADPGSYSQYADWFVTALRQLPGLFTGNVGKFGVVGGVSEAQGSNAGNTTAA